MSGISAFLAILRNIPRLGTVRALAARIGHPTSIALDNGEITNGVLTKASVSSQTVEVFTEDGTVIRGCGGKVAPPDVLSRGQPVW